MQRYSGYITDIKGLSIGHWTDEMSRTGCSVLLCAKPMVCGVDVRGAAPGTRETDLLKGYHLVERIDAVLLSGGSAFGLASADGVMKYLESKNKGFPSGNFRVPIVPTAVLYDLEVGDGNIRPNARSGFLACENARLTNHQEGAIGVGTGTSIGKIFGTQYSTSGGLGMASLQLNERISIAGLVAVNALGNVYNHRTGQCMAGAKQNGCFLEQDLLWEKKNKQSDPKAGNTSIGIIATNAELSREQANRLAEMAQDGLALSIRPVHTPYDGDALFGISTQEYPIEAKDLFILFASAAEVMARAVQNAVLALK